MLVCKGAGAGLVTRWPARDPRGAWASQPRFYERSHDG